VWMTLLPVAWHFLVQRQDVDTLKPSGRGLCVGTATGVVLCAIIYAAFHFLGRSLLDPALIQSKLDAIGFTTKARYLGMAAYWILVNSLIEEFVWRWFVTQQFQHLVRPWLAVVLSGIGFTLHHIAAVQVYFGPAALVMASIAIFIAGVTWSALYVRYRSIWPGYISHAFADAIIFGIGFALMVPV
jgi:membrane protease YdiL (CAAX protease family)